MSNPPHPEFGEKCTVVFVKQWGAYEVYKLQGYPQDLMYGAHHFAPTSDIDESERLEAYLEEQEQMDKTLMALVDAEEVEPLPQEVTDRLMKRFWDHVNSL